MPIFANGLLQQQFCVNLPACVRIRVTLRQVAGNNVQIRTCLLQRHSRPQSSETGKCLVIPASKKIVIGPKVSERNDNVAIPWETDALGNDTNYFTRHSIDVQTLSKGKRQRTETISPEQIGRAS